LLPAIEEVTWTLDPDEAGYSFIAESERETVREPTLVEKVRSCRPATKETGPMVPEEETERVCLLLPMVRETEPEGGWETVSM